MSAADAYSQFLAAKVCTAAQLGFDVDPNMVSDRMKPHCRAIVPWMLAGGRRALFTAFGLHKTVMQLEAVRLASEHVGGRGLIVVPLGVRAEFRRDAVERLGWAEPPKFIRRIEEATTRDRWAVIDGDRMRMLSVSECRRAMGFSDTYQLPARQKDAMNMLGNAVCPPVAADLIRELEKAA